MQGQGQTLDPGPLGHEAEVDGEHRGFAAEKGVVIRGSRRGPAAAAWGPAPDPLRPGPGASQHLVRADTVRGLRRPASGGDFHVGEQGMDATRDRQPLAGSCGCSSAYLAVRAVPPRPAVRRPAPAGRHRWSPGCRLPVRRPAVSPRTSSQLRPLVSGTVDQAQSLRSSASAGHRRHRNRQGVPLGRRYHPDRAPSKARTRDPRTRDAASRPRRTTVGHAARATLVGDAGYRDAGAAPGSFQSTT